jgi:adenylate cyclase class IV
MALEVEFRAKMSASQFAAVEDRLRQVAEDLGPDDKQIWFYVLPDKLLKVVHDRSHDSGRIVVKSNKIGHGAVFPETEVRIPVEDIPAAIRIFDMLGFSDLMHQAANRRHNYRYRHVEIAMKWSEAWSHHAELEVLLPDGSSAEAIAAAESAIASVAADLGIRLMTDQQLVALVSEFEIKREISDSDEVK